MSVDVRKIMISEGIKLELVQDHAREMNNLKDLYLFENQKVVRLEEAVKNLRLEIVKQRIEFDDEIIETIETMEKEKYEWKTKYEEVMKITELLIHEFEKRTVKPNEQEDATVMIALSNPINGGYDQCVESEENDMLSGFELKDIDAE